MSLFEYDKIKPNKSHLRYNVPIKNHRTKTKSNFSPESHHPHDESKNSLPHIQQKLPLKLVQSRNASFVISKTQESDHPMRNKEKSPLRIIRHNTSYRSVTPFDDRDSREKSFGSGFGFGDTTKKKDYANELEQQMKQKDDLRIQERLKEMELERVVQQGDYFYKRFGNENKKGKLHLKKLEKYNSSSTVQTIDDFSSTKKEGHNNRFVTPMGTLETQEDEILQRTIPTEHSPESTMSIRRRVRTEGEGNEERTKEYLKKLEYKKALDLQVLEQKMKKKREEDILAYEEKMDNIKSQYNRLMTEVAQPAKYIPRIGTLERNTSYDSKNLMELSKILELYKPKRENSSSPQKTDLSTGRTMNETIKRKGMKHSYSTADETNSPNYRNVSSLNQSINKMLGPGDLTTISFSKLEAMSAHLKKVVQTIGPGKDEGQNNNILRSYSTVSHLDRSFEKKKEKQPVKLILMKGNIESKKIGQLKKISKDEAVKKAYGLPGDDVENQYKVNEKHYSSLRARSVEKSDNLLLQTASFEKQSRKKNDEKINISRDNNPLKKENSNNLQIIIPETPPSEREDWKRVREVVSSQKELDMVEEDINYGKEEKKTEGSPSSSEIFKKTKSTEILNKPIKITTVNQEKSLVVVPEKQEKKGGLVVIKEEEEEKIEKSFRLTLTFKKEEEEENKPSQDRKIRKHSKDLPYNSQGQKRKRSELEEISVFESGTLKSESL